MKIFHYRRSISDFLKTHKQPVAFVPTMGALHQGHLELVKTAKTTASLCAVSIFVNPRQFNNPEDLLKYPRTIREDLAMLQGAGADVIFIPAPGEIFVENKSIPLDLGGLAAVFEGKFRPGHFQGVVDVLYAFFNTIKPDSVYFGQKDLQQCMVVEKLVQSYFPQITQHNCPTIRETSGLAMSSRNRRLSKEGHLKAAAIYKELRRLAEADGPFQDARSIALKHLDEATIQTEYLELVELPDMTTIQEKETRSKMAVVFAGYLEGVRLIDNVLCD